MKKTAILIMIITIVSKVFGFGREIILSYFYGASNISDAYLTSLTIPTVIFSFIGTGISTGYIPIYSKIEKELGEEEGELYTNNLINILIVLCTVVFVLSFIFTELLIRMFAAGFEGETFVLAVKFTRISLLGIYFTGMIYIFSGFLQIKKNYVVPAMIAFPMNFFIIAAIVLSSKGNIMILIVGTLVATISQFVLVAIAVFKQGYRHRLILSFKDEYIKKMVYIAVPIIIGVSVDQINVLVDRTVASKLVVGGISSLNYASKLTGFVQGLFVLPLVTVMYPMISKMSAEMDMDGLKRTAQETIGSIVLLVVPVTIGAMVFAMPVVELLFGRGAFDKEAISMTSDSLFFYAIGMLGFGLREVLSRIFYSMQDTKTPMINAVISVLMNIILILILSKMIGIAGLALSTSISAIFCTGLLLISLRNKIGPFGLKSISVSFFKVLIASFAMGALAKLTYGFTADIFGVALSLGFSMLTGLISFVILVYAMKVEEVKNTVDILKRKIKPRC